MGSICNGTKTQLGLFQNRQIWLSNPQSNLTELRRSIRATSIMLTNDSLILGCKKNQNLQLLNKYMLVYSYFSKCKLANPQQQIEDFTKLLTYLDGQKKHTNQIQIFQQQYLSKSTPRQKVDFLIQKYYQNGFLSESIQKFPTVTFDPSVLGYARRPITDLFKGIKAKYQKQPRKKQIYCVLQVSQSEEKIINNMAKQQDYFTFSTFIRCFSNEQKAKKQQKNFQKIGKSIRESDSLRTSTLFFNIQIPNEEIDKQYDYGFVLQPNQSNNESGDIIMNVLNFFQITGYQSDTKTYDLKYNGLSRLIHLKRARLLQIQPELLKIHSLIQAKASQVKSHSHLLRVVKNSQLSITASQSLKSTNGSNIQVQDNQRINLIEAYLQQGNYVKALSQCKETIQFKVRKAQIHYENKKYQQVDKLLASIQAQKDTLKKDYFTQFVLYELISAKRKLATGQQAKGKKQLEVLRDIMKKEYRGAYQFRGRQVQSQILRCSNQKNKINQQFQRVGLGLNLGLMLTH